MDERERHWRERNRDRDWRRSDDMGRGDQRRYAGGEDRSWGGSSEGDRGSYGGGGRDSERDRVFGERESGMGYGGEYRGASGGGRMQRGGGRSGREDDRPEWQDRDYQGVSPAMQHGEYDLERRAERFQREHPVRRLPGGGYGYEGEGQGGRYYGDAGREQIYREEWSQGARDTGQAPRGYDAGRDHERGHFSEDYEDRMFSSGVTSGGTGGYDYERGYGDGGRQRYSEGRFGVPSDRGERWEQRGREAGRDTGDFFRRAGERVASWFGGGEREQQQQQRDWHGQGQGQSRDFRGMGPKGYKRNDERISDEVHERLTDDPYIDASNINIAVSGGEVTLSGTVAHRDAKHRAERIIEDVSGVSHVQNNLRVASGGTSGESVLDLQARGESGSGETMGGGGGLRSTAAGGDGGQAGSTSPRPSGAGADTGKSR
jgi:osmotically-inducible protein OsmY